MNAGNESLVCSVCSSPRIHPKPFGYQFNGKWLEAVSCRDCGMIYIHPQPSPEEIAQMYSKEYFEGDFRCGHEGSYFNDDTLDRIVDETLLRRIKQYKPDGNFLEIGCAGGAFLNAARTSGYTVQGVEFSDDAARFARSKFNLDVRTGDLRSANYSPDTFDVVFMGDVLEHLPAPADTLREIRRVMKPGGILVIECPMQTNTLFSRLGFLIYQAAGKKAKVHLPPYHLFEYRPESLKNILVRSGLQVIRKAEFIVPPREVALRGSLLQKIGKKLFQYPNYLLTRIFGIAGDRIEVFATKQPESTS